MPVMPNSVNPDRCGGGIQHASRGAWASMGWPWVKARTPLRRARHCCRVNGKVFTSCLSPSRMRAGPGAEPADLQRAIADEPLAVVEVLIIEGHQFDSITRHFAVASRRATLGGLLGFLGTLAAREEADALIDSRRRCARLGQICSRRNRLPCCPGSRCRNLRCRCAGGRRPCKGKCIRKNQCCRNRDCPGSLRCRNGRCRCPNRQRRCQNQCIPADHCCRHRDCGVGERCDGGRCRAVPVCREPDQSCADDADCCAGQCIENICVCREPDELCDLDDQCCSGVCNEYSGRCAAGCLPETTGCRESLDCCSGCCSQDGRTCGDFGPVLAFCIVPPA